MPGVGQPVVVHGQTVTSWIAAQDRPPYARLDELGVLLRRLHRLGTPKSPALPRFDPAATVRDSLRRLNGVASDDRAFLAERGERLLSQYAHGDLVLPFGLIHGDANVGNTLRDRDGRPILSSHPGSGIWSSPRSPTTASAGTRVPRTRRSSTTPAST